MTSLEALRKEQQQTQQRIQLCNQRVEEVQRCQEQEEETRREAKERLEEAVSTSFSQLRVTFEALNAAMKGIKAGKQISSEDIPVPTFGKIDDLKSFFSQSITKASGELEEKRNQLNVEVGELEDQVEKMQILQENELRELNRKKGALKRKQQQLESERENKSQILTEEIIAADIEIERRIIQRAIRRQYEQNLSRFRYAVAYELEENASQEVISRLENERQEEVRIRLVKACQDGEIY